MHDLSFDPADPVFSIHGWRFTVSVYTFENRYALDPAVCAVTESQNGLAVSCSGLTWAGGQERAEGAVLLRAEGSAERVTFHVEAKTARRIRSVKITLLDAPRGPLVHLREGQKEIPARGLILRYPDGWRGLYTPLIVVSTPNQEHWYARSLDTEIRDKRFAFLPVPGDGERMNVELIHEDLATKMGNRVVVPPWEVGACASPEAILREHASHIERSHPLVPWEERSDVPAWARHTALVAAIHGQHWTGHIFNDYDAIRRTIHFLADRLDGQRILAYLPGWEGRYYWQYGDYRPDERMGGKDGFRRLCDEARERGVRVMPMFGINVAGRHLPNFEQWGGTTSLTSGAGGISGAGSVDWDGSRHYDHGSGTMLNPGAPSWQNHLVEQIGDLADTYGFDGVFLDISAVWLNDPRYDTYKGVVEMIRRLRENRPEMLVAGEGWYDGVGLATPLMQSGHTDGRLHWHDELPYPPLFDRYHRCFAHLCLGDPSRGSSGVHEQGFVPTAEIPLRRGLLPTLTLTKFSLEESPDAVEKVLESARAYASAFLSN